MAPCPSAASSSRRRTGWSRVAPWCTSTRCWRVAHLRSSSTTGWCRTSSCRRPPRSRSPPSVRTRASSRPSSGPSPPSLDAEQLYSLAMAGAGGERVLMVGRRPVAGAEVVPDERSLLERFLAHVRSVDPDVLTGWNVCDFDLTVLLRFCHRAGLACTLGRSDDELELQRDQSFTRESRAILCGRQVLDGLALLRSAFLRLEDYRLETAARALLGRGKLIGPEHRGTEIEAAYREDPARLAAYNLEDCRLVLEILERTGLVDLAVRRSLLTGMQLDRVGAAIASVDSLYLGALRTRDRVAPSVGAVDAPTGTIVGGLVLDSRPGLYRNILVFD